MCMSKKKENKRRVVKYTLIIFLSVFIYYKCPYRYYTTYFTDYYQVVMKDGEADYMNYLTLLKANGKPNKIWEEQLSKNLVVRYMKYDDGRIFVFDIKKQPYRFCRVEITNPEYRFGRKKIGIGTSKKKIEKVYKKAIEVCIRMNYVSINILLKMEIVKLYFILTRIIKLIK